MLEHNSFDKNWNDVFASFFIDFEIYISLTIIKMDLHTKKFIIMFILKQNHKHRKNFKLISIEVDHSVD